jgi:hypothetical protein
MLEEYVDNICRRCMTLRRWKKIMKINVDGCVIRDMLESGSIISMEGNSIYFSC